MELESLSNTKQQVVIIINIYLHIIIGTKPSSQSQQDVQQIKIHKRSLY